MTKVWMKISLIVILFLWFFINPCFALNVSDDINFPYRIYTGEDKNTDWVDVCSAGYIFNGEYIILFEDKSPIKKIYLDENMLGEKFYWIVKEKSIWKFFDEGINSRLQLAEPVVPKDQKPILIYSK